MILFPSSGKEYDGNGLLFHMTQLINRSNTKSCRTLKRSPLSKWRKGRSKYAVLLFKLLEILWLLMRSCRAGIDGETPLRRESCESSNPCYDQSSCTANAAGQITCGSCPTGMRGDGRECADINEVCWSQYQNSRLTHSYSTYLL